MREDHREQRIGDLGILIVELLANSSREKSERLDEPLDVWILTPIGCEFEQPGNPGVRIGELPSHVSQEDQLAVVVVEEVSVHVLSLALRLTVKPK